MTIKRKNDLSRQFRNGFTIVELLIVVVVIAILAAVTIVAYNGINQRAKASAAQSATSQVVKKITAYAVTNADRYPTDLSSIEVANNGNTSYQYRVDNTAASPTFCLTVTVSDISYFASATNPLPSVGGCPGHGQNGVATVTNLITNPSFEHSNGTVEVYRNLTLRPTPAVPGGWSSNNGTVYPVTRVQEGRRPGSWAMRGSNTANINTLISSYSLGAPAYTAAHSASVTAGKTYKFSAWMKASHASNGEIRLWWRDEAFVSIGSVVSSSIVALNPGADYVEVSGEATAPAGATRAALGGYVTLTGGALTNGSQYGWITDVSISETAPTAFDGDWSPDPDLTPSWTGTPHASESILTGQTITGVSPGPSAIVIRSTKHVRDGTYSARIIAKPVTGSTGSYAILSLGANPAQRGTFLLSMHREEAMVGGSSSTGAAYWNPVPQPSSGVWRESGSRDVRVHAAPGPGGNVVVVQGGIVGTPDLWFDNFFRTDQQDYTGPARNGSSQNWIWDGVPHASSSTGPGI